MERVKALNINIHPCHSLTTEISSKTSQLKQSSFKQPELPPHFIHINYKQQNSNKKVKKRHPCDFDC
jgi:hypothetical protein